MPRKRVVSTKGRGVKITLSDQWLALADQIAEKLRQRGRCGERGRSHAIRYALALAAREEGIDTNLEP